MRSRRSDERSSTVQPATVTIVHRISKYCRAFFTHAVAALEESRRREAERIIQTPAFNRRMIDQADC
jgi:hypothetical protein